MFVDFEYIFCVNFLNLKFCTHVINIEMVSSKNIMAKNIYFNPWEGNSEIFLIAIHVDRFQKEIV